MVSARKKWDLLVVEGCLIAAIEFKSQVGSFGNNYNNRTEEALGSQLMCGPLIAKELLNHLRVPGLAT